MGRFAMLLLAVLSLAACETTKGFVKDVETLTDRVADEIEQG
jgi:predicted small secreted protein